MRQALYRIYGEDEFGMFRLDCYSEVEYNEAYANVMSDPMVDNIWVEFWDEEEGWQA